MPLFAVRRLLLALLIFALTPPAWSDWKSEPFSATEADLRSAAEAAGASSDSKPIVLYREVRVTIDKKHRQVRTERRIYRVGENVIGGVASRVQAGWVSWLQDRPAVRARVLSVDGRFHELDPETLSQASPPPQFGQRIFSDLRILQGPLPAAEVGALVEVEVVTTDRLAAMESGVAGVIHLASANPTVETIIRFEVDRSIPFAWRETGELGLTVSEEEDKKVRAVSLRAGRIDPKGDSPVWLARSAWSDGADHPRVEFGTARQWRRVAAEYGRIVDERATAPPGSWPKAEGTPREIASTLLAEVHERVRYASVALGAASIVPREPAETLERRYGDCKDQSTLLVALLKEAGVAAHVALLNAGGLDVEPSTPGFGRFDHAIVYVPPQGAMQGALWIDPTAEFAPVGELPVSAQDRWALIAAPDSDRLVKTPAAGAEANRMEIRRVAELSERGRGVLTETRKYAGEYAIHAREAQRGKTLADLQRDLDRQAERVEPRLRSSFRVLSLTPSSKLEEPYEQATEVRFPERTLNGAPMVETKFNGRHEALAGVTVWESKDEEATGEADRIRLSFPHRTLVELRVTPPPGFRLRELPKKETVDLGTAVYEEEFLDEEGTAVLRVRFDSVRRTFEGEEARRLRDGVLRLRRKPAIQVRFDNIAEQHLRAGRVRQAMDQAKAVLEEEPGNVHHRWRLARAYLAAGGGLEAREQGRIAVESAPEDPTAHFILGTALAHDLIGRRHLTGMDRDGAEEAFRRSSELDEISGGADYALKTILTLDGNGRCCENEAAMADAVELGRELAEENKSVGARQAYSLVLSQTGRYEEMLEFLEGTEVDGRFLASYLVEATAPTKGVDQALDRAARFRDGDRARALEHAAWRLAERRRYPLAAALYRAAAQNGASTRASENLQSADLYEKTVRHETLKLSPDDPTSVVKRWLIGLTTAADWRAALEPLAAEAGKAELRSDKIGRATERWIEAVRGNTGRSFQHYRRRLDEALGLARFQVEGNDDDGYRVRATWPNVYGSYSTYPVDYFVLLEDGEYRVLDTTEGYSPILADLGAAAMERLDQGAEAEAYHLLDLAVESKRTHLGAYRSRWSSSNRKSPALARMTAAAFMAFDPSRADEALTILLEESGETDTPDGGEARELAVLQAATLAGREAVKEEWLHKRLERDPAPDGTIRSAAGFYFSAGRKEEAFALLDGEIGKREPELAIELRTFRAILAQDVDALYQIAEELDELGADGWTGWNQAAWMSLVETPIREEARAAADRAAQGGAGRSYAALNTRAAVYGALGEPETARKIFLQSLAVGRRVKLRIADWFVAGLAAEAFGLNDTARHAYEQVLALTDETGDDPFSGSAVFAGRRLARLSP